MSYVTLDRYQQAGIVTHQPVHNPLARLGQLGQADVSTTAGNTKVLLAEVLYLGILGAGIGVASSWYARGSIGRGALAGSVVTLGVGLVANLFAP